MYPPVLIIRCRVLPLKPWPLSIADIPIWFSTSQLDVPLEGQAPALQIDLVPQL